LPFSSTTPTIYGGNLFSTLAGEYAYSLSIALGLSSSVSSPGGAHRPETGVGGLVLAACHRRPHHPAMFVLVGAAILTAFEILPEQLRPDDAMPAGAAASATSPGGHGHVAALWWARARSSSAPPLRLVARPVRAAPAVHEPPWATRT